MARELVAQAEEDQRAGHQEGGVGVARAAERDRRPPQEHVHQERHVHERPEHEQDADGATRIATPPGGGSKDHPPRRAHRECERGVRQDALRVLPVHADQVREDEPCSGAREHGHRTPEGDGRGPGGLHPRSDYRPWSAGTASAAWGEFRRVLGGFSSSPLGG